MRKKILTTVILTVIFALVLVTTSFVIFSNVREYNKIEKNLRNYATYLVKLNIKDENLVKDFKINGNIVRCTYIDKNGNVVYDNVANNLENHFDREEVKEAINKGEGYDVRVSDTTGEKLVYYAMKLDDGSILRLSIPYHATSFFNSIDIRLTILLIIVVILFSVTLSMKIVKTLIDPLKDLESVTNRIAKGDLHIRVNVTSNDEIGSLGVTFNNMADQLQAKINEVIDKQNRLESILSSMQSGVIAVNVNDEVITINPYARKVLSIKRYVPGEKLSSYIKDYDINSFLNEEDDLEKEIKVLFPIERELRIRKASLVNGRQQIGKVIAIHDITDIKKLENMRSQFVANVSHELKTPLTSIKGFSETLKFVEDKETRDKFLDIINSEAERLSRLINDILVLSKLESSGDLKIEEVKPKIIIGDVIHMVKSVALQKNIFINTEENKFEGIIENNRDKFLQLALNLIENAVKYSNEGAVVNIRSYTNGQKYILEVEDNGIGIPEEDIPRIFERFYRVDRSRKGGGTGLGLAIVKHIVKCYNGEISVYSEFGKGTKFVVKFNI